MVPPDSFSTAAPQSSSAFCSGCDAGTQCDSLSSKVFSCPNAGVTLAASSNAKNVFLIGIFSLVTSFTGSLRILLYDIIINASRRRLTRDQVQAYNIGRSKYCGQK